MSFVVCVSARPGFATSSLLKFAAPKNHRRMQRNVISCEQGGSSGDFPADQEKIMMSTASQEKVREMVLNQAALVKNRRTSGIINNYYSWEWDINEAYDSCIDFAVTDACSIYFGNSSNHLLNFAVASLVKTALKMLTVREQDQIKALAALTAGVRKTDELVDGINGCYATPEVLDKWEQRLIDLYEGHPHDMHDAALGHALSKFPINLQLLRDGIQGMRMDISKTRYESFDELYLYLYHVVGTLTITFAQLFGTSPESKVSLEELYNGMLSWGISLQLADILLDVAEDAAKGRIYLPQDELTRAGLSEDDIYGEQFGSNEWRNFMKEQITRARAYADEGEKFINELNPIGRSIAQAVSLMNRERFDTIEANNYIAKNLTPLQVLKILPALLTKLVADQLQRSFSSP